MAVDPGDCRALAELSRLSLSDAEAEAFAQQLARVIGYFELLAQVDVDGVPEFLPGGTGVLRGDEPGPTLDREQVLAAAPDKKGDLIAVPKFKEA